MPAVHACRVSLAAWSSDVYPRSSPLAVAPCCPRPRPRRHPARLGRRRTHRRRPGRAHERPAGVTGRAINAGAKLYFDSINAKGGVRGRPVSLVTRDDGQNPVETVRLTKELIAGDSPVAMIGTVGTTNLEALAKDGVLQQRKVTMVGAVSGAASVAQADGMHVVKASYHDEVARLFSQLNQLGIKNVGLVYQDDGLGQDVLKGAEAASAQDGRGADGEGRVPAQHHGGRRRGGRHAQGCSPRSCCSVQRRPPRSSSSRSTAWPVAPQRSTACRSSTPKRC